MGIVQLEVLPYLKRNLSNLETVVLGECVAAKNECRCGEQFVLREAKKHGLLLEKIVVRFTPAQDVGEQIHDFFFLHHIEQTGWHG